MERTRCHPASPAGMQYLLRMPTLRSLLPLATALLAACATDDRTPVDLLISGGSVITMDSTRRVIEDGAVAIDGDSIVAVGTAAELGARFTARETIDGTRKIIMPGLIDGHGHAGHGLVKSLGMDTEEW